MSAPLLLEGEVALIIAHLQANLSTELAAVGADPERADNDVSLETPDANSYFTYYPAKAFHAPAIFVVGETLNMRQAEKQSNYINALGNVTVSLVVEDREEALLTKKAFRYASALHSLLECQQLIATSQKLKIHIRVDRLENGAVYTDSDKRDQADAVFRREVALYLNVEHFENF